MERCRWMRWKGYAGEPVSPQAWAAVVASEAGQCACLQTFQPWGPDGQPCAPERCGAQRPCYATPGRGPQS